MQRALVLCDRDLIRETHIVFEPPGEACQPSGTAPQALAEVAPGAPGAPGALAESLALAEQRIILEAVRSNETRERIAERLGISPRTLRYKLARLRRAGIDCDEIAAVGGSVS
jgi:two-component system response regulator FlrC